jgi:TonB family protein
MSGRPAAPVWRSNTAAMRTISWKQLVAPERDPGRPRLLAALALSIVMHVTVLVLPLLGERHPEYRHALKGSQRGTQFFNATLVMQGTPGFSGPPLPAEGENVPSTSITALDKGNEFRPEDPGASGAGLLPLPGLVFYTTDQLSKRPQPMAMADLEPAEIKGIVASGKIVIKLWIAASGSVVKVEVESSSLPSMITKTAVEGFKRLRFEPGLRDGQAVGVVMRIVVDYDDNRKPPK